MRDERDGGKEGRTEGGVKGRRISERSWVETLGQCRGPSYMCLLSRPSPGSTQGTEPCLQHLVWKLTISIPLNVCF